MKYNGDKKQLDIDVRTITSDYTERSTSCFSCLFQTPNSNSKNKAEVTPKKSKYNPLPNLHPHEVLELQNKGRPEKDKKPPLVISPQLFVMF
jgi:hypothetical protein